MIPSAILGRYARSLAEIVFEENVEPQVTEDLKTCNEIFRAVPDLLEAFHSPSIPRETKEKLLAEMMRLHPVAPITSNFMRILIQHNRIRFYPQILDSYLKSVNDRKGIVTAHVTAAAQVPPKDLKSLESKLAEIMGRLVNVEVHTDAGLLGGVVVQVGSTVFDGSIRTQLSEMRRRLTET
ncbi:MAG: ATP synthase F1 subunit delta [Acidobacteria bacterium]|nr:ATP synthase F1 subunit delta [Acidobacteriota bacterium]